MTHHFLAGTPAWPAILSALFGTDHAVTAARLAGHRLAGSHDGAIGLPVSGGTGVDGVVVTPPAPDQARLDHVLRSMGAIPTEGTVRTGDNTALAATVWIGPDAQAPDWDQTDWQARFAPAVLAALPDLLALMGQKPAETIARRFGLMLVRSASRHRAVGEPAPASLRRGASADDLAIIARHEPYARFFAVEEYDLSIRRFDGTMGPVVNRAAFISGDAVTVLPYDPLRDRVLLIEQFRAGPLARGDANPFSLEVIAGRVDAGETPEQAGRREAIEEAGLTLGDLLPIAGYYPSPGAKAEYLYSYLGLVDLPDGIAGTFGLADEAEDIRGHLIGFDRLMELVTSGEINNAPLFLSALWLQRERPGLRAAAGGINRR